MTIKINDRITLRNKCMGIVRYIGPVQGKENEWLGIELEEAKGSNDGKVDDKRYFKCQEKHGIFVKYSRIAPSMTEIDVDDKFNTNDEFLISKNKFDSAYDRINSQKNFEVPNVRKADLIIEREDKLGNSRNKTENKRVNGSSICNLETTKERSNSSFNLDNRFNTRSVPELSPEFFNKAASGKNMDVELSPELRKIFKNKTMQQLYEDCNNSTFITSPSLFDIDMYGEDKLINIELGKELDKIQHEYSQYKKTVQEMIAKFDGSLNKIKENLNVLEDRVGTIKNSSTTDKERWLVVNLVSNIFKSVEKKDQKKVRELYAKFKTIMLKYQIKVE